jgi:hypothetical protein
LLAQPTCQRFLLTAKRPLTSGRFCFVTTFVTRPVSSQTEVIQR